MQPPCYLDPPLTLSLPFPPPFSPPQARIAARKVVPPAPPENLQQWKLQIWCFPPTTMIASICVWGERTRLSSSANSSVSMHKLIYLRFSKNNNSWAYFFCLIRTRFSLQTRIFLRLYIPTWMYLSDFKWLWYAICIYYSLSGDCRWMQYLGGRLRDSSFGAGLFIWCQICVGCYARIFYRIFHWIFRYTARFSLDPR